MSVDRSHAEDGIDGRRSERRALNGERINEASKAHYSKARVPGRARIEDPERITEEEIRSTH